MNFESFFETRVPNSIINAFLITLYCGLKYYHRRNLIAGMWASRNFSASTTAARKVNFLSYQLNEVDRELKFSHLRL
jgi:hypothetical protein